MDELTNTELTARLAAAEEALRKAEIRATVGQLALEMIHEIRNPLEAMSNLTFLARQEAGNPERVRTYLNMAEEQMAHLRYISGKTLRYSKSAFSTEAADLVKVAEAALRIHHTSFTRNQIRLVTDLPEQVIAHIHFGGMLQVISNLLANAIDALSGSEVSGLGSRHGRIMPTSLWPTTDMASLSRTSGQSSSHISQPRVNMERVLAWH